MNDIGLSLGLSRKNIGFAGSTYGAIQLFSSPIIGTLSDSMNRGSVLALSQALVGVSYVLLASSLVFGSLTMFFVSRVCTGLFKHTSLVTKALVTDTCDGSGRATAIGLLYTSSAVAFAIGPAIGGLLVERMGLCANGFIAGFGYFCCAAFSYYYIATSCLSTSAIEESQLSPSVTVPSASTQATTKNKKGDNKAASNSNERQASAQESVSQQLQGLGTQAYTLLAVRLAIGFAMITFFSSYRFFIQDKLDLGAVGLGYATSIYSTGSLVAQTFLVGLLRQHMSEHAMAVRAAIMMGVGILCVAFSPSTHVMWTAGSLLIVAMSSSTLRIAFSLLLTESSPSTQRGKVLGLADSVMSIARVAAPGSAGILSEYHAAAPMVVSAVLLVIASILIQLTVTDPSIDVHATDDNTNREGKRSSRSIWSKLFQRSASAQLKTKTQ